MALTGDSLNQCALRLGWQPTWITEFKARTTLVERMILPLSMKQCGLLSDQSAVMLKLLEFLCLAFVKQPRIKAGPNPSARAVDEGGSSSPPGRTRRRITPPRAINRANRSHMVRLEPINVESEENAASHAPSDMASVCRGADGGVGPAGHSFEATPASVDPEPAASCRCSRACT